jgi:hypothetical protein
MKFYHINRALRDTGLNKNTVAKIYAYTIYAIHFVKLSECVFQLICKILDLAYAIYWLIFRGGNIGTNIIILQNFEAYFADDYVKDNLYWFF